MNCLTLLVVFEFWITSNWTITIPKIILRKYWRRRAPRLINWRILCYTLIMLLAFVFKWKIANTSFTWAIDDDARTFTTLNILCHHVWYVLDFILSDDYKWRYTFSYLHLVYKDDEIVELKTTAWELQKLKLFPWEFTSKNISQFWRL